MKKLPKTIHNKIFYKDICILIKKSLTVVNYNTYKTHEDYVYITQKKE